MHRGHLDAWAKTQRARCGQPTRVVCTECGASAQRLLATGRCGHGCSPTGRVDWPSTGSACWIHRAGSRRPDNCRSCPQSQNTVARLPLNAHLPWQSTPPRNRVITLCPALCPLSRELRTHRTSCLVTDLRGAVVRLVPVPKSLMC